MQRTLFTHSMSSHTGHTYLEQQYTLRACNRDYRSQAKPHNVYNWSPELDGCKQHGKIAPLTTFDNTFGHCNDGTTMVFSPCHHDTLSSWMQYIDDHVHRSLNSGYAWQLKSVYPVQMTPSTTASTKYPSDVIKCINAQIKHMHNPISVYSVNAYIESRLHNIKDDHVFKIPSQSTLMTGILGGINNNTTVEMGFDEPDGVKNEHKRAYTHDMVGFICCGHTAHSEDAGKSRRMTSFTRVRVISHGVLANTFSAQCGNISSSGIWYVYCMGSTFSTDLSGIICLVDAMNRQLRDYGKSQFNYPHNYAMSVPPTYVVYYAEKILAISISSGVVVRLMPDGMVMDSAMYHHQPVNPIVTHCKMPPSGIESIMYRYSAFFLLCPYLQDDRPPRTLLASGQTVQAVCFPWAPATAKVAPCHSSKPLVTTQFMRHIQYDQQDNDDAIWDILPGEDMMVCFANMSLNYDDSMIVSSRFADYGGFETLSICTYRLFANDVIPNVGDEVCSKRFPWWKMPCSQHCICNNPKRSAQNASSSICRVISDPRVPTAIVTESTIADNGEHQVRVMSHAQLMTGDKISTTHGQKGIVTLMPVEDLPVIIMPDGTTMVADIYMAVSSITSRQTVGQILESSSAYCAARDAHTDMIADDTDMEPIECKYLLDGGTGQIMTGVTPAGNRVVLKASVGIIRVFNQTQLTRERHHLTHLTEGKYSLGTASGRTAGGGVATSEMDFHAMFSSGMTGCAQELLNRGNVVRVGVCLQCKHIQVLCDCDSKSKCVPVRLSYDVVIFDILSACANGSANTYDVQHV